MGMGAWLGCSGLGWVAWAGLSCSGQALEHGARLGGSGLGWIARGWVEL